MKDKKARTLALIAVIIGVLALSLGFAAYSTSLTVKSLAEIYPDEDIFDIDFSYASDSVVENNITPVLNPDGVEGFSATDAVIDNSDKGNSVIKNLHAIFTAPGQSATYTFYTKNNGDLKGYLKNVTFNNVTGEESKKVCTAKAMADPDKVATQSLVDDACNGITLTLKLGSESFTDTKVRGEFTSITAHDLIKRGYEQVQVRIAYEEGSDQADGGFDVAFGDIVLSYSSVAS